MSTYYDELVRELHDNEQYVNTATENGDSPSEVAGRDETTKVNDWSSLSPVEKDLLEALHSGEQINVPTGLFELMTELLEEYSEQLAANNSLVEAPKSPSYKHSRIRVQLSRPLTVAEAEKFHTDHHIVGGRLNTSRRRDDGFLFKLRVSPNRTHVWVDADLPSRPLFDVIAAALEQHFVNVYPTAVRTFTEYHA